MIPSDLNEYTSLKDDTSGNKVMSFCNFHKPAIIGTSVSAVILVGVLLAVVLPFTFSSKITPNVSNVGHYSKFAVATDHISCSELGKDILGRNGTAVDAAIASMFCACIFNFQSCGIGGGFLMVIYQKPNSGSKKVFTEVNARETAPLKATADMFKNASPSTGGLSIAVPGEVRGSYTAWKEFGKLPWKDLIAPTVNWLKNGFEVSFKLGYFIKRSENLVRREPEFSKIFVKADGSLVKEGDIVKMPKLAVTMQKVADDPDSYYNGELAKSIAEDLKDAGSIITLEEMNNHTVIMREAYKEVIPGIGLTLYSISPPGSGPVISYMLKILDVINMSNEDMEDIKGRGNVYHRITEAMKFGFAEKTYLGDDQFTDVSEVLTNISSRQFVEGVVSRITLNATHPIAYYNPSPESTHNDKGTSHLSILAADDSAVAATSTINLGFGSGIIGARTGILFNNEMDDFSLPNKRTTYGNGNLIEPGKRPMSSMIPSIYTDNQGKVKFVMGASGGPTITSSNLFVMAHRLWLNYTIEDAVNMPRFHHQLNPNKITYEQDFNKEILEELRKKGHDLFMADEASLVSIIQVVENACDPDKGVVKGCITALCDWRKAGTPAGF